MGFGILLIGYFVSFASALAGEYYLVNAAGGAIVVLAVLKLASHSKYYDRSVIYSSVFVAAQLAMFVLINILSVSGNILLAVIRFLYFAACMCYVIGIMYPMRKIAADANDKKLEKKCVHTITFMALTFIFSFIYSVILRSSESISGSDLFGSYRLCTYIFCVIAFIYALITVYYAYSNLFIMGREQTEEIKESRFKIVNFFRKKFEESRHTAEKENYEMMKESAENAKSHPRTGKKKKKK